MEILVTNNPMVKERFQSGFRVDFIETDVPGILTHTRNLIHKGHRLLTHPLSGSIKPNESLYKSILLSVVSADVSANRQSVTEVQPATDVQSVSIIEECILTAQKFPPKNIPEKYIKDMQIVDLSLISTALENR